FAPLMGALIGRVLMRPLHGASVETTLTVTIGLLLILIGLATIIWDPTTSRVLPQFFAGNSVSIFGVVVTWHQLTVVIVAAAVAVVGRLKNLPLTFAGGVVLGLVESYAVGYLPTGTLLSQIKPVVPMVFLFIVILVVPQGRLRAAGRAIALRVPRVAGWRESLIAGVVFVAITWVVSAHLSSTNLATAGHGMAFAIIMLSLVLLVGYGGQVSLCQLTFAGLGAFAMGEVAGGGAWLGVLAGIGLAGAVGALVALPAIRLRGLYLALSTLAFAEAMDFAFFQNTNVFGTGSALSVGRVHIPGISLQSPRA